MIRLIPHDRKKARSRYTLEEFFSLGEIDERTAIRFPNALSQFQEVAHPTCAWGETNRTIDEAAVAKHAFQRSRFLRDCTICYDDAAGIRERACNQVEAWQCDDRVAYAAEPED